MSAHVLGYGVTSMTPKKLEPDSEYSEYDTDGDGVVTDAELGLSQAADILGDMASVYFVAIAGLVAAFFGASAWANRSNK
jgi:hypothetical protein